MKKLITIMILFVAVGCGKSEPLSPEEKLVGTYKRVMHPSKEYYYHMMLRKDGVCEKYWLTDDGKESDEEREIANWEVKNDELTVTNQKKNPVSRTTLKE